MSLVEWSAAGRGHDEADKENREQPANQQQQQPSQTQLQQQQTQQQLQQQASNESCCSGGSTAPAATWWAVQVTSRERSWTLRRSYDNFRLLDEQLHRCVYDRQHSRLPELPEPADLPQEPQDREVGGRDCLLHSHLLKQAEPQARKCSSLTS
ncbi:hypothetical protein HPB51_011680 [Rhipicephalus microplus]|uniref:PX domain-containing protein n=1 Tax=Rhipicephalus microplus TaxID=6941 RepID=A0A9J6DM05_RHIMP|nr:hypothetical protein HPB51_011680 [Rhipicephalus microplus]